MTREVVVIRPQDSIIEGARQLLKGPFGCLPVVESERLVGILTEADFVKFTVEHGSWAPARR